MIREMFNPQKGMRIYIAKEAYLLGELVYKTKEWTLFELPGYENGTCRVKLIVNAERFGTEYNRLAHIEEIESKLGEKHLLDFLPDFPIYMREVARSKLFSRSDDYLLPIKNIVNDERGLLIGYVIDITDGYEILGLRMKKKEKSSIFKMPLSGRVRLAESLICAVDDACSFYNCNFDNLDCDDFLIKGKSVLFFGYEKINLRTEIPIHTTRGDFSYREENGEFNEKATFYYSFTRLLFWIVTGEKRIYFKEDDDKIIKSADMLFYPDGSVSNKIYGSRFSLIWKTMPAQLRNTFISNMSSRPEERIGLVQLNNELLGYDNDGSLSVTENLLNGKILSRVKRKFTSSFFCLLNVTFVLIMLYKKMLPVVDESWTWFGYVPFILLAVLGVFTLFLDMGWKRFLHDLILIAAVIPLLFHPSQCLSCVLYMIVMNNAIEVVVFESILLIMAFVIAVFQAKLYKAKFLRSLNVSKKES